VATALATELRSATGAELHAEFMPVGALEQKLLAGERCDVVVSTQAMLEAFAGEGRVDGATTALLGRVHAGIAARAGARAPAIDTADGLRAALAAAKRIYVPDPERATAGRHFVKVMREMGLYGALSPRLSVHGSGVAAMTALASSDDGCLGSTQVTEIRGVPGVTLIGALPAPFDLVTTYAAAVCANARDPELARRFVAMLVAPAAASLRSAAGFEA
jgi:molybdate transport system substrate-binding protein